MIQQKKDEKKSIKKPNQDEVLLRPGEAEWFSLWGETDPAEEPRIDAYSQISSAALRRFRSVCVGRSEVSVCGRVL